MKNIKDLKGQKFERLKVLEDSGERCGRSVKWLCICKCGNFTKVRGADLANGKTKSCGCLRKMQLLKHGHGSMKNRLYRIWLDMKDRCLNSNTPYYKYYGGKGVKIYEKWKNDFTIFRYWAINSGYQEDLTIDRIENDGDYFPNNCQWITKAENIRKSHKGIKHNGYKHI